MEGLEELCRMGLWDFAVSMSGSDLPLRGVEDLEHTLVPHRGKSVISYIGMQVKVESNPRKKNVFLIDCCFTSKYRNADLRPEKQMHCLEAFLGCEGYTFNVTR